MKSIQHALIGTESSSCKAIRKFSKNINSLALLINTQVKILPQIRKLNPDLLRNEAILVSLLNAASLLTDELDSEKNVLSQVNRVKKSPQLDWLKIHKNYVYQLRKEGASLREIE